MRSMHRLTARAWPTELSLALTDLEQTGGTVLALFYSQPPRREHARTKAREALLQCLAARYPDPAANISLQTAPGRAPELRVHGRLAHASFSHESLLSLVAIHLHGPVGIDVLSLETMPVEQEDYARLAHDYLPPQTADRITSLPPVDRQIAFARAWVQLEATLKCNGKGLTEWDDSLKTLYRDTTCTPVDAGTRHIAALACRMHT